MKLDKVIYENGDYWVYDLGGGMFEVYRNQVTGAIRKSQITYTNNPDYARKRAIAECDRRAEQ